MKPSEYTAMFGAESQHWWYRNLRDEASYWIEKHLAACPNPNRTRLLDIGCGTGGMLQRVHERFKNLTAFGLDYYAIALGYARKATRCPLVQGDVKAMPFNEASFDLVLCLDVLYTDEAYPAFDNALRTIYGLLNPKGMLLLQLPAFESLRSQHDVNVHGAHRFTAKEVRASLRRSGFERFAVYYRYNLLLGIAWIARKFFLNGGGKSQVATPPIPINFLLHEYSALESWINKRFHVPFGLSVFAVAYRED